MSNRGPDVALRGHVRQALIDLRVRNLYGAEALYIKEGGIHRSIGHVTFVWHGSCLHRIIETDQLWPVEP